MTSGIGRAMCSYYRDLEHTEAVEGEALEVKFWLCFGGNAKVEHSKNIGETGFVMFLSLTPLRRYRIMQNVYKRIV